MFKYDGHLTNIFETHKELSSFTISNSEFILGTKDGYVLKESRVYPHLTQDPIT